MDLLDPYLIRRHQYQSVSIKRDTYPGDDMAKKLDGKLVTDAEFLLAAQDRPELLVEDKESVDGPTPNLNTGADAKSTDPLTSKGELDASVKKANEAIGPKGPGPVDGNKDTADGNTGGHIPSPELNAGKVGQQLNQGNAAGNELHSEVALQNKINEAVDSNEELIRQRDAVSAEMNPGQSNPIPRMKADVRRILKDSGLDTQQQMRTYTLITEALFPNE